MKNIWIIFGILSLCGCQKNEVMTFDDCSSIRLVNTYQVINKTFVFEKRILPRTPSGSK